MQQQIKSLLVLFSLAIPFSIQAADVSAVSFFSSNNVAIIDPQHAYQRVLSEPQTQLNNSIIDIMQTNHMEQNKSEDSIGMYQMENNGKLTADNTKIFTTSPYQIFSDDKAFTLATQLANALQQESVALFIPDDHAGIGDASLRFSSHEYTLRETINMINEKLPQNYAQAYSLHLGNKAGGYEKTTVVSVEWLGSKIDPDVIQRAFPLEEVVSKHGKAYLVFKNGEKQEI